MGKKVLITGGHGFIGTHLKSHLESFNWLVYTPHTKLDDHKGLEKELTETRWDAVVHLAAVSAYNFCEQHPAETFNTNIAGTALLARLISRHCPTTRLVFASTAQVYTPPMASASENEFVLDESWDTKPSNTYPQSKLLAEKVLSEYSSCFGLKATVLRIFNHTHRSQSADFFLPYVYSELIKAERAIEIPVGNIDVKRDIGAVDDLVAAFRAVLDNAEKIDAFDVFNVCTGKARVLRNLAEILAARLNVKATFKVDPSRVRVGEPASVLGSSAKLTKCTGWKPSEFSDDELIDSFLS